MSSLQLLLNKKIVIIAVSYKTDRLSDWLSDLEGEGAVGVPMELCGDRSVPGPSSEYLLPRRDPPGDEDSSEGVGTYPGTLRESSASLASNFLSNPFGGKATKEDEWNRHVRIHALSTVAHTD